MPVATVRHERIHVAGHTLFVRQSVPDMPDPPTLLLLHGFPSASHQYRRLIDELGHKYRIVAPDYPGFGFSDAPDSTSLGGSFEYTFDQISELIEQLLIKLQVTRFVMYVFDFGAPVGFRIATRHPEWVAGLIAQNGNAYEAGLGPQMQLQAQYWADRAGMEDTIRELLTEQVTRAQYETGAGDPAVIAPEGWTLDQHFMDLPGRKQVMLDLLYDYQSNTALYPSWQRWLRETQPPMLITWGRNDDFFPEAGARAYLTDVPDAELHLLDGGHFTLDEHLPTIAPLVDKFMDRCRT